MVYELDAAGVRGDSRGLLLFDPALLLIRRQRG
jgi:hypothetical protein